MHKEAKKVFLKKDKERSLLNFHPWVFSGAIAQKEQGIADGDLVEVFSADKRLLGTGHYNEGSIAVRLLTFGDKGITPDFWITKIENAFNVRKSLGIINEQTNAYRLLHGEGDGLPGLIIDIYNDTAVIQCHSKGMHFSRNEIAEALKQVFKNKLTTIYDKTDEKISNVQSAFLLGNKTEDVVLENAVKFYVNWSEGQKTGFFNDQRDNRNLLQSLSANKNVLNLFSYSGGFSVYALKGGATNVDSVDSSAKAKAWCEKNVELNFNNASHTFYCEDAIDFLKKTETKYDIMIVDPPAFAKHLNAVDKASIGYKNLNHEALKKIKPGGIIFTFSCSQVIDKQLFRKIIFKAAAQARRPVRILYQLTQPADHPVSVFHPEGEYLKGLVLKVD